MHSKDQLIDAVFPPEQSNLLLGDVYVVIGSGAIRKFFGMTQHQFERFATSEISSGRHFCPQDELL